jgi:hypothetical protein
MNIRSIFFAAVSTLACWTAVSTHAQASEVLYDGTGFLQGTQSFVQSFNLNSPGTLTVSLSNVAWPQKLASLNLLMTSANGAVGPEMGAGTATFDVKAGNVFAQWFGTAQGPLNTGVYSMEIQFQPATSSGNPVPLPTSIGLLLSGLGLLAWQRRTRVGVGEGDTARSSDLQVS